MKPSTALLVLLTLAGASALPGCATEPLEPQRVIQPPPPDTNVYFYPGRNRPNVPAEQQDRDKYECNSWAVQQTGFDPSLPSVPPHQRVQLVAGGPPPGAEVGAGALTGAVVGAAVSPPWRSGHGALLGGLAGAAIGGIAEAERANANRLQQEQANANAAGAQSAALEQKASQFRRALSVCLEGRGYSVQ